jgi:hypothetical protein
VTLRFDSEGWAVPVSLDGNSGGWDSTGGSIYDFPVTFALTFSNRDLSSGSSPIGEV